MPQVNEMSWLNLYMSFLIVLFLVTLKLNKMLNEKSNFSTFNKLTFKLIL